MTVRCVEEINTGVHVMMVLDYAASQNYPLPIRFAALVHDLGKGTPDVIALTGHHEYEVRSGALIDQLCERLRVPAECRDLARMTARWHGEAHRSLSLTPDALLALLAATDALRRPGRFRDFVDACACDHHGRLGFIGVPYPAREYLLAALASVQTLDFGRIAKAHADDIPGAISRAKLAQLQRFIEKEHHMTTTSGKVEPLVSTWRIHQ